LMFYEQENKMFITRTTRFLSTDPDASVLMLKSLVDGIADVSSIWDVVREKILPNFQIWNILLDKGW
jgi:hypothetical protein